MFVGRLDSLLLRLRRSKKPCQKRNEAYFLFDTLISNFEIRIFCTNWKFSLWEKQKMLSGISEVLVLIPHELWNTFCPGNSLQSFDTDYAVHANFIGSFLSWMSLIQKISWNPYPRLHVNKMMHIVFWSLKCCVHRGTKLQWVRYYVYKLNKPVCRLRYCGNGLQGMTLKGFPFFHFCEVPCSQNCSAELIYSMGKIYCSFYFSPFPKRSNYIKFFIGVKTGYFFFLFLFCRGKIKTNKQTNKQAN